MRRAKSAHCNKYEYDEDSYKGISNKICIKCSEHGWFLQRSRNHTELAQGCRDCGQAKQQAAWLEARHDTNRFVENAEKIHGKRYD